ncbi:MAG: tetratricopeptide repeat protein [Thermodesulfobacteriota bacterium]
MELKTPGIRKTSVIIAAIIFILSASAFCRNAAWLNETSLWSGVSSLSPNRPRPHYILGNAYDDASVTPRPTPLPGTHSESGSGAPKGGLGGISAIDEAIKEYKEAIRLRPSYKEAVYNLGTVYDRQGDIDSAIKEYKKAAEIDPSFYLALNNLGYAYSKKGLFKEAIAEYKKALRFFPQDPDVRYNLAMAYAATGLKEKAREEFLLVLSVKPDDPDTMRELARIAGENTGK